VTLLFEDELTVRYQIQEMLRIEKTFEEEGIQDELDAYGPLVPDGTNLKATMMIEYDDPAVRKRELARLIGIEDRTYVQVDGLEKVYAIADEDLERENEEKTSSVHFLRFEFTPAMIDGLKKGAALAVASTTPTTRCGSTRWRPASGGAGQGLRLKRRGGDGPDDGAAAGPALRRFRSPAGPRRRSATSTPLRQPTTTRRRRRARRAACRRRGARPAAATEVRHEQVKSLLQRRRSE